MTYTVYIDVVFFVNAVMDFVVLAILNRILDSGAGWGRLLSGAAVGGLWACLVSVLPGMPVWLRGMGTYLGVSWPDGLFGLSAGRTEGSGKGGAGNVSGDRRAVGGDAGDLPAHQGRVLSGVTDPRGAGHGTSGIGLVFGGGGRSSGGLRTCRPGKESVTGADKGQKVLQVRLGFKGSEAGLTALIDTGNCLKEPVSGRPVHVVTASAIAGCAPGWTG